MNQLDIIDNRTPEQLVADDDHRWPPGFYPEDGPDVRRIYLPPQLSGRERRIFLRRLLKAETPTLDPAAEAAAVADWQRAGGDVLCPQCGEKLYDHPREEHQADLTIACDRRRYHL